MTGISTTAASKAQNARTNLQEGTVALDVSIHSLFGGQGARGGENRKAANRKELVQSIGLQTHAKVPPN